MLLSYPGKFVQDFVTTQWQKQSQFSAEFKSSKHSSVHILGPLLYRFLETVLKREQSQMIGVTTDYITGYPFSHFPNSSV